MRINPKELPTIKCICGNDKFKSVTVFRWLSAIRSGKPHDDMIPEEMVVCTACGQDAEELEDIKKIIASKSSPIISN